MPEDNESVTADARICDLSLREKYEFWNSELWNTRKAVAWSADCLTLCAEVKMKRAHVITGQTNKPLKRKQIRISEEQ